MAAESLKEWVNSSLSHITSERFNDCISVTEIDIKPLTDQLIIVVSDIYRVKLKLKYKNGKTSELKAVYKIEPTKQGFDQFAKELGICDTETLVYDKILKLMEILILENNKSKELLWPECYICVENKFLLQDLTEEGFEVVPTYDMLGVDQALLALYALGQYHGMSLVLVQQGSLEVNKLPTNFFKRKVELINNMYSGALRQLADYIEQNWQEEWKSVPDKLRKAVDNVGDKLQDLACTTEGKCSVLNHGDFTMRNMLFKYDGNSKKPIDVKLIDFQAASWSNLAFDIVNLTCSSLMPQIREENIHQLLEAYSISLHKCLSHYGYNGYFITLNDIKEAYYSFNYLAMLVTLFTVPAFIGSKDDTSFVESLVDLANSESLDVKKIQPLKNSFFEKKEVREAIKFQLELSLKQKTL